MHNCIQFGNVKPNIRLGHSVRLLLAIIKLPISLYPRSQADSDPFFLLEAFIAGKLIVPREGSGLAIVITEKLEVGYTAGLCTCCNTLHYTASELTLGF